MATALFKRFDPEDLENGPFGMLSGVNSARFDYLRRVLEVEFGDELQDVKVLDIGCGIGLLTLPLARLGCSVAAVDPSPKTLAVAKEQAGTEDLDVAFCAARAEQLPYPDASFDVITCCDVLEHVDDLEQTLSESSRALKPGGIFIFATLNRTFESWLLAIKALQQWPWTRVLPADLHQWPLFIKPRELTSLMAARNLNCRELTGLAPSASPLTILSSLHACKRGEITAREFGERLRFKPARLTRLQYLGYAIKRA